MERPDSVCIKEYFQKYAENFDSLYSKNRNIFLRLLDALFRRDIHQRFVLTLRELGDLSGRSVLDVGCGSGRYCVALAKKNALLVMGLDLSENMLKLAQDLASRSGVGGTCRFIKSDFEDFSSPEKFDLSLAIGVFDYVREPDKFLRKLKALTKTKIIASFPRSLFFRTLQRKMRYQGKGCPVFFYDKNKIIELFTACDLENIFIKKLQGDWFVAATLS